MTTKEILAEAQGIIESLRFEKKEDLASTLSDTFCSGFGTSEWILALRYHLARISDPSISNLTQFRIRSLMKEIDALFDKLWGKAQ